MSNEKRFISFVIVVFLWMIASSYLTRMMGLNPPPPKKPPAIAADQDKVNGDPFKPNLAKIATKPLADGGGKVEAEPTKENLKAEDKPAIKAAPTKPEIELVAPSELVLGSLTDKSPTGYLIEAQLEQKGAGIESVHSSRYDAELGNDFKRWNPIKRPLQLIGRDPKWPPSLALTLSPGNGAPIPPAAQAAADGADADEVEALRRAAAEAEDPLDSVLWEVVRDEKTGKVVRPVPGTDPVTHSAITGQEVWFQTKARNGVVLTKTFRLFPNSHSVEVELKFESPDKDQSVVYNLLGPHGIPIEGEWYTGTFRDVVFGQLKGKAIEIITHAASDVAGATANSIDNTALPLVFAGIENQYFAILVEPKPIPTGEADRWDSKTTALVLHKNEQAIQKSDVGVRISSKPIAVGPNRSVSHNYRVFAGPKTVEVLAEYKAEGLASYHKNQWFGIPFAADIARVVITPTLRFTYEVTARVAHLFGRTAGNYGVAIILLTVLVRGLMFPIGRKQALAAQKMQQLQPLLKELQEKYKDDKERQTKEQFALYKKHGVNPVAGCLPALIQLPIFVGLWQALNTSFPLRHATFLWIRDLSAPDMLFRLPFEIPFLGNWFNVLPFVVVALMLVQTKLFAPPATTPEAEMQQKTMKYMMIFMGVMFYKVPSGLGLYFITSSLWAICERLLLPKVTHLQPLADAGVPAGGPGGDKGSGPAGVLGWFMGNGGRGGQKAGLEGNGAQVKVPGRITQFFERVLDEARKDPTYRKIADERDGKGDEKDRDRDRDRPRPKPRRR
jgi:YidC/Oxa1 family membrane protein insertase